MSPATLLYDAECGFCRWALAWVLRLDRGRLLRPLALQSAEAAELLAALPEARRMRSWHLLEPDGIVSSGGRAFAPLLERLPRLRRAAPVLRAAGPLPDWGYRIVAANRDKLGPLVPERSKAKAQAIIERRSR